MIILIFFYLTNREGAKGAKEEKEEKEELFYHLNKQVFRGWVVKRIVLIAGFESFNADLYRNAAELAVAGCHELEVRFFSKGKVRLGTPYL